MLPESDRKDLAIRALARSATISDLSARHGVSRKFVSQQARKAGRALDDVFLSGAPEDEVLFQLTVTKTWLRQVVVALTLICRSSYRGVVEFLRDLLGMPISIGTVHHMLQLATRQAGVVNHDQDLSGIRVGLHDEIFQGAKPVLAGVDAASTSCYLLAVAEHRDADTWGVHLLDATKQGLKPDHTIADAGQGLRAGQRAAWENTPCHGDVFHIQRQCEGLANTLSRLAKGARSRCEKLEAKIGCAGQLTPNDALAMELARQTETQAHGLARDIRTLTQWLSHDVLALAGPALATRQVLFDFIVEELAGREPKDVRRIRPLRVALRRISVTICSRSPACSTPSWPTSRRPMSFPSPSCVKRACCIGCRPPQPPIGRDGTDFGRSSAANSTGCSTPSAAPWRKHRAAVRWSRTSIHDCATTSRIAARDDVLTNLAISYHSTRVGHEHSGLARNVGAQIPGVLR